MRIENKRTNVFVVLHRMMFSKIIAVVVMFRTPIDMNCLKVLLVLKPIKPHINSFSFMLLNTFRDKSSCGGITCLDRGQWLNMTHFEQGSAKRNQCLCIVK